MKRVEMTSYETTSKSFEWKLPAQFNYGGDVVDAWAIGTIRKRRKTPI
ncbi:hypothetical protein TG4357_02489 [Thalassovita gelatinovora]|uniref:Uncharacterized protein n=1 Tax=Thalassovita gelatinovora TaxID=53501 RepID=A0A0P1FEV5_THAGE|nr:hypothetical protein [Thalassovita gelatinovora]CUH66569.1 hypothetical protein TG4357_02489 [Thalassovita gelatinovora]SEQ38045.1 hypothetical protein SAMN04488043_10525 [Thalassovita gelatinovora]